jgi:hypothetical protein
VSVAECKQNGSAGNNLLNTDVSDRIALKNKSVSFESGKLLAYLFKKKFTIFSLVHEHYHDYKKHMNLMAVFER